jgi:trehalose 6-phosphate synthase/phosphatase
MNTGGSKGESKAIEKISALSSRINGEYGSIGFSPVRHIPNYLLREEYFALLRIADVALITSVRDGMSTISMEYAICQKDHHGPLILSEFSGTSSNLDDALHVNPWDTARVVEAIEKALTMPDHERKIRSQNLYQRVLTHNVQNWTNTYIKRLLANLETFDHISATPPLDRSKIMNVYRNAKKRVFMFDYDGTLTPIVQDPKSAIPSDRVLRSLKTLAADPQNEVWIISGRDQAFLEEWMGHIGEIGLSAEHGSFVRYPQKEDWVDITEEFGKQWQDEVLACFQRYTEKTQGSFIERKKVAVTWHYRRADPEYGAFQAGACCKELERTVAKRWDVEVMAGKANLEVRPNFVNKGEIVKTLIREHVERGETPGFILCAGDDFTDEGMALLTCFSIIITDILLRYVPCFTSVTASRRQCLHRHSRTIVEADARHMACARTSGRHSHNWYSHWQHGVDTRECRRCSRERRTGESFVDASKESRWIHGCGR